MAVITAAQAGGQNLVRFLDLLAWSEGTSTEDITKNDGYDVIVTCWQPDPPHLHEEIFTDYSDHPFLHRPANVIRPARNGQKALLSSASGRYQHLVGIFEAYKTRLKLPDFSPLSQDKVTLQQIRERGAIASILAGNLADAVKRCSNLWASLPGNTDGQGGKTFANLQAKWEEFNVSA